MSEQPKALRLADAIWPWHEGTVNNLSLAAAELRRLHKMNQELLELLKAVVATRNKHFIHNEIEGMWGWDDKVAAAIAKAEGK